MPRSPGKIYDIIRLNQQDGDVSLQCTALAAGLEMMSSLAVTTWPHTLALFNRKYTLRHAPSRMIRYMAQFKNTCV